MILALLHAVSLGHAASLGAPQVPAAVSLPPAIASAHVAAAVQMSATHFVATSFADEMQWLVFSNAERGLRSVRRLGPRERALLPVVAGAAEGMSFEVLTRTDAGRLVTSGAIDCDRIAGTTVYFTETPESLVGWLPRHGGRALNRLKPDPTALPAGFLRVAAAEVDDASMHVPVPVPAENRKRDKSRRLRREKLPPV